MDQPAIRIVGLAKRFGAFEALRPLHLEIAAGEVLGYLGPNGAGKTTTIRILLGLIAPSAGAARVFGRDVATEGAAARATLRGPTRTRERGGLGAEQHDAIALGQHRARRTRGELVDDAEQPDDRRGIDVHTE